MSALEITQGTIYESEANGDGKDFIGFWYDDLYSGDLGIVRTSDGSRYNEDLLPQIADKITQVPGQDGAYFFGTQYTTRTFSIPIAFDHLTEMQFTKLKQVFGSKEPKRLIFEEAPYKYYLAKANTPPQLKYICFDENGQRVYKGEGTISLIAYDPFGHNTADYFVLDKDNDKVVEIVVDGVNKISNGGTFLNNFKNYKEWNIELQRLPILYEDREGNYYFSKDSDTQIQDISTDPYCLIYGAKINVSSDSNTYPIPNYGDLPCDFQLFYDYTVPPDSTEDEDEAEDEAKNARIYDGNQLNVEAENIIFQSDAPEIVVIDSKTNCLYGVNVDNDKYVIDYQTIYNKFLVFSVFNKIAVGNNNYSFAALSTNGVSLKIKYNYY